MRITKITMFLLTFLFLHVSASTLGQNIGIEISVNNSPIESVIKKIESNSNYHIFMENDQQFLEKRVTINKQNNIESILEAIVKDTEYKYRIVDQYIVISKAETMQDKKDIHGTVVDENGAPLIGVAVVAVGTTKGVITDIDGKYLLKEVDESQIIRFSFIGMNSVDVPVEKQSTIDIQMEVMATGLDEVIAIGYGTQKKVNLTGAITPIKMDELGSISSSNLSNTLSGRAPGVNITNSSGLAGASSSIRIRGSFGEPLYVIDGIIADKRAFDALETSEVDQLSFLKDAATASIYGSRAGNGVVLVTTKRGHKQKPILSYQGSYSVSSPTETLLADETTATDELIYQNRVAEYLGLSLPNGETEFAYFEDKNYNVNDMIWQNPWNTKHSINVSGGSDNISYYALVGYRNEEGSYKNLDYERFNLRSNVTAKITNRIKLNLNISGYQQNSDRFYWPFGDVDDTDNFNIEDLYRCTFNWPKTYPFYLYEDGTPANEVTPYPVRTPMGSWSAWNVIDQVVGDRYIKSRRREMNTTLSLEVDMSDFIDGLTTKVVGNYIANDHMSKTYHTFQENYEFIPADTENNRFIPSAPDPEKTNIFTFSQNQEFLQYDITVGWKSQLDWFLNYKHNFGSHAISAMTVLEQQQSGSYTSMAKAEDPLTSYDQMFVYSSDAELRTSDASEETGAAASLIGRLNYNFAEKYIAEFSFRYDGNTLFPESKRWGFFPSVSAAWRVSEEDYMRSVDWLDNLKLRASYGTTGNDLDVDNESISAFSYMSTYENGDSYMFGDDLYGAIEPSSTPNPNLTWATSTTYNVGFDFGLLKNRLTGGLDLFLKKETDILGTRIVSLPYNYGQELAPENYAARSWRGGEFNALWQDSAAKGDIKYSVHGNIGYAKDRWDVIDQSAEYLPGGNREDESQIGQPLDRVIGLNSIGMVRTQEQLDELLADGFQQYGRDPYLGGLIFEDIRGDGYSKGADGKIDDNDFQVLSTNSAPRINYGFGGSIEWKGFVIDAHFQGVGAYDRFIGNLNGPGINQYGGSVRPYYPIWTKDVWTPENPDAKLPRVVGSSWYESGTGTSSFWMVNGSYLRLKNLNVAYNLSPKMVNYLGIKGAQVFFNGTNLFSISEVKEYHDPEQKNYDSYPVMRSFTLGLDFKF